MFLLHWLMVDHLLSANLTWNADDIRPDTVGVLAVAQMGRGLGQMDDKVSDRAFLRSDVVLRGLLRAAPVRHRTLHTGGELDGDNRERDNDGGLPAELVLLGGLPDGCQHRGVEMFEPRAGLGGVDDTGGRHSFLHTKLRRRRGATGEDVSHRSNA